MLLSLLSRFTFWPFACFSLPLLHLSLWVSLPRLTLLVARLAAGHRSMRTVTNYFLLNLSIADLLMSSLNCVFNFIFMVNSDWPFGSIYCTINNFVANVTVSTSVFTLVAISFDRWVSFVWILQAKPLNLFALKFALFSSHPARYIAIVHPLKRRTSRRKVRFILVLIWALSCVLSAPCLLYSSIMTKQ